MTVIFGLAGSLRAGSRNAALLREAVALAPTGSEIRIGSIEGIPLYNADVQQAQGFPETVLELKRQLRAADGLLLVTPEYNNSIPGVFKNAIDWVSRPADEIPEVFGDLPVAVAGAGGRSGTRFAQSAWLPVFRTLGMRHWSARTLYLDRSWERFDDQGRLVDDEDRQRLARLVREFAAHCGELPRSRRTA
jgi:chromate reductase